MVARRKPGSVAERSRARAGIWPGLRRRLRCGIDVGRVQRPHVQRRHPNPRPGRGLHGLPGEREAQGSAADLGPWPRAPRSTTGRRTAARWAASASCPGRGEAHVLLHVLLKLGFGRLFLGAEDDSGRRPQHERRDEPATFPRRRRRTRRRLLRRLPGVHARRRRHPCRAPHVHVLRRRRLGPSPPGPSSVSSSTPCPTSRKPRPKTRPRAPRRVAH